MEANYVGPGWYWVEGTNQPLFLTCNAGRLTAMVYVENIGIRESTTSCGEPFKILTHIPRPIARPVVDWSVMPAWAKWVCGTKEHCWIWTSEKPTLKEGRWDITKGWSGGIPGEYRPTYTGDWKNSLVGRPE